MSEQLNNNHEKIKPMFDDCNGCGKKYQLTAVNSSLHIFVRQPDCNFIRCTCPKCSNVTKLFVDAYTENQGVGNGIPLIAEEWADDTTYTQMLDVRGIRLVAEGDITKRHETEIGGLALTFDLMPDEQIQAEFATPQPPKRLPEHWRDNR